MRLNISEREWWREQVDWTFSFPRLTHPRRPPLKSPPHILRSEITKNGYTRSNCNHDRVHRESSTKTPPGRSLIGRTAIVPGSGTKQPGYTICLEFMFQSTRSWLPCTRSWSDQCRLLGEEPTHTHDKEFDTRTHDQHSGYESPPHDTHGWISEITNSEQQRGAFQHM